MGLLSLLFSQPLVFTAAVLVFLIALTIHEGSHALAAYLQGDKTAQRLGRLTLNPTAHVDIWGFIALVTVGFGWGKPVPFNPYNLKNQRIGPVLVAGAGPMSNILFGILSAVIAAWSGRHLGSANLLTFFWYYSAYINFVLCLFNLIPIPPLDGSKALLAVLAGERYRQARAFLETQGPILLIGLMVLDALLGVGVFNWIGRLAQGLVGLAGAL